MPCSATTLESHSPDNAVSKEGIVEPLRELRIPMQLEIRLWGMDCTGKPFSQTARTIDISGRGARLAGVVGPKQAGDIIGVQYGDQKARFQVVWVGASGTPSEGQIGITCMDAGRCIWATALEGTPGQFGQGPEILRPGTKVAEPTAAAAGGPALERRRYPRYSCSGGVELRKESTDPPTWAKLTDIGLGGCYVELMSTLPLQTQVEFVMQAEDLEVRGRGVVRTTHPGVGNGIAFTQMKTDDWRRLNELIARLARPQQGELAAEMEADVPQPLQALLELLENKGVLTRSEFASELRRIKSHAAQTGPHAAAQAKSRSSGSVQ